MRSRSLGTLLLLALLTGCDSTYYGWGRYQDHLYELFLETESFQPADEVGRLVDQIEEAEHSGRPVPPGLRAHLGYLYAKVGNQTESVRWLIAEKRAFPEATVFIDGMLARMQKSKLETKK
jgi:hypothetical protein